MSKCKIGKFHAIAFSKKVLKKLYHSHPPLSVLHYTTLNKNRKDKRNPPEILRADKMFHETLIISYP